MSQFSVKRSIINSLGLIFIILSLAFVRDFTQNQEFIQLNDKVLSKKLKHIAREINVTMPIVVEEGLICENVNVLPGRKFQYNFTLTKLLKSETDTSLIRNFIRQRKPVLTNAIRSDSTMEFFRQQNVVLIYTYRDKYANYLYNITIKPEDYRNSSHSP